MSKKETRIAAVHKYSRVNPGAVSNERVAGSLVHCTDIKEGKQEYIKQQWSRMHICVVESTVNTVKVGSNELCVVIILQVTTH